MSIQTNDEHRLRIAAAVYTTGLALMLLYIAYQARRTADAIERMEARQLEQERKQMQALEDTVDSN